MCVNIKATKSTVEAVMSIFPVIITFTQLGPKRPTGPWSSGVTPALYPLLLPSVRASTYTCTTPTKICSSACKQTHIIFVVTYSTCNVLEVRTAIGSLSMTEPLLILLIVHSTNTVWCGKADICWRKRRVAVNGARGAHEIYSPDSLS